MWSTALRYSNEFNGVRIAAGIAYSDWRDDDRTQCVNLNAPTGATPTETVVDCHSIQVGASIMHMPTGLYVSGGWTVITDDNRRQGALLRGLNPALGVDDNDDYWWIQLGWAAKLVPLGDTTFWVDYEQWNNGLIVGNNFVTLMPSTDILNSLGANAFISSSRTESWGIGVTQAITAASMNLYLGYKNFSTDLTLLNPATGERRRSNPIDDFQVVYTGATVRF